MKINMKGQNQLHNGINQCSQLIKKSKKVFPDICANFSKYWLI